LPAAATLIAADADAASDSDAELMLQLRRRDASRLMPAASH